MRLEFCRTGIHPLIDRRHTQPFARRTDRVLVGVPKFGQTQIGKPHLLGGSQPGFTLFGIRRHKILFGENDFLNPAQEPGIDPRGAMNFLHRPASAKSLSDGPGTPWARYFQGLQQLLPGLGAGGESRGFQSGVTDFQRPDRLLKTLFEGATDGHYLAHTLHLSGQSTIGIGKFFKSKTGHLRDHVVDAGLKASRCFLGYIVSHLVQRKAHGQLGGDLGDGKTRGLGGQSGGSRYPRIHLDDHDGAVCGIHAKLDVGAPCIHADLAHDGHRSVTHLLVFAVRERLGGGHCDRIARMHPHGVEIFDGADHHHVVGLVAHDLQLVFLPTKNTALHQAFGGRGLGQGPLHQGIEILVLEGDAAPGSPHCKTRPNDGRQARVLQNASGLGHGPSKPGGRYRQTYAIHRLAE